MVDPNPARGMPLQLQRYWLAGKGAAKIRWGMPNDFYRCRRLLRKFFPKNPSGLCNILHQKALGAPPGKGHPGGHSIDQIALVAAQALMDQQPMLGKYMWAGPVAAIGRPTSEPRRTRIFEMGALRHRMLPLPFDWREHQSMQGHAGAVTVGRVLGLSYGPNEGGLETAYGWGDFFDEDIIPDAKKARYVMNQGVLGASVDPGGRVVVTVNPENGFEHTSEFTIGGVTAVPISAFSGMQLYLLSDDGEWPDDDMDMVMDFLDDDEEDCGCDHALTAAVNPNGWKGLPLAMRDSVFDNDDAVKRITAWANGGQDTERMRQAFMYYDPQANPSDPTSYRLPVGDVINGNLTLIYHAIYAAAALISGAHGGLPNIPDQDKSELRNVISEIYSVMADEFADQSIRAPWDRSAEPGVQMSVDAYATETKEPYGDVEYADPGYRNNQKRYPIDTPKHIRAAWAYINVPENADFYDAKQLAAIKAKIKAAAKKHGIEISDEASMDQDEYALSDTGFPLTPPALWFENPRLPKKTPLTVTDDGQVYGHLAAWGECHRDIAMRECVMAPRSHQQYAPFHLGSVVTAEGDTVQVGKIVTNTNHADVRLGYSAAVDHYAHTGAEAAVIRAGEDEFGIWVAGAMVPEANARLVAKLRRSPLSGDWRRQQGHLELTAALAVNAPAFPVYSMEADGQWSLVAAGSVYHEEPWMDERERVPVTSIVQAMTASVTEVVDQSERAQRLADILEDEEIYAQRDRVRRFDSIVAASTDPWSKPVKAAAPVAAGPGAPAAGAPTAPGAPVANPAEAELVAMNADAQYTVTRDEGEVEDAPDFEEADAESEVAQQAPSAQEQVPVQPPVQ